MSTRSRPPIRHAKQGETHNTDYYLPEDDILLVVPHSGSRDTAEAARINVDYQRGYARGLGRRCAVVVAIGQLAGQDSAARRVYAEGMDAETFYAAALVVDSALARAIGSFFLGLTRPSVPTKLVESIDAGIEWARTQRPAGGAT